MATASSYQFGQFELDLRRYELKRDGQPLRLERIPMELLVLLVEHTGELIPRGQIIEKLWGKQVFLDTEQGINTAIRKVRQVLQDDPEKPQFLETVVGKAIALSAMSQQIKSRHRLATCHICLDPRPPGARVSVGCSGP
jgi:DNA-binding winged helix-turn-helix (wHTH) protein